MKAGGFVGRAQEIDTLRGYLDDARKGQARYVFVSGEAGIGKARVVGEFAERHCKGSYHLHHSGTEAERSRPYAALGDILTQCKKLKLGDAKVLSVLEKAMDSKVRGSGDPQKEKEQLYSSVFDYFHSASKSKPIMISIDDAQYLDQSSVLMLGEMVRELRKSRILFIGTYCPDELEDSAGNPLPLAETLATLMVEGLIMSIQLGRLTGEDTGHLVAQQLSMKRPDARLTEFVFKETEGLPLLIEELLEALLSSKAFNTKKKDWVKDVDFTKLKVPKGLNEALEQKICSLPPDELDVLQRAAVLGTEFKARVLENLVGTSREWLAATLSELIAKKLIYEVTGLDEEVYRFVHSKAQQAAYDSLGKRAKEIHESAGAALEALYPEPAEDVVYALAGHFSMSGNDEEAVSYSMRAARFAVNSHAPEEGLRYYRQALRHLSKVPPSHERGHSEAQILLEMADTEHSLSEWDSAHKSYEKAFNAAEALVDAQAMSRASSGMGSVARWHGQFQESAAHYKRALDLAQGCGDDHAAAIALKGLGYAGWRTGTLDEALENHEMALKMAKGLEDTALVGVITLEIGNVHTSQGKLEQAETDYLKSIELLEGAGDMFNMARAYNNIGDIYLQRKDWDRAIQNLEMCAGIARAMGIRDMLGWAMFNMGEALAKKGELDKAEQACLEALEILEKLGDKTGIAGVHKDLGIIYSLKKSWKKSDEQFAIATRLEEEMNVPDSASETYREWAEANLRRGDKEAAREHFQKALAFAEAIEHKEHIRNLKDALKKVG